MDKFYFWMYRGLRKIRKEEDPAYDAMLGVLFFIGLNLIVIIRTLFNINNINNFTISKNDVKILGIIWALIMLIIAYFGLYRRREQIFSKMSLLSAENLKRDKSIFIIYIIVSAIGFYITTIYF